jgi:hypothetical protein
LPPPSRKITTTPLEELHVYSIQSSFKPTFERLDVQILKIQARGPRNVKSTRSRMASLASLANPTASLARLSPILERVKRRRRRKAYPRFEIMNRWQITIDVLNPFCDQV